MNIVSEREGFVVHDLKADDVDARSGEEGEYILGTEQQEVERLRFQHKVWVEQAYALWRRAGIGADDRVLDLGCGPGFTSMELANIVGPGGRVIARDKSERFLVFLKENCERQSCAQIELSLGSVEDIELPAGSLDAAYARWLLSWVEDAGAVVERVAQCLRPGGVLVLQEYLDWGAMRLAPRHGFFDRAVAACLQSFKDGGATIDIGERVPEFAAGCDLEVEYFAPVARAGGPGSMEWRWVEQFLLEYLPKLAERGLIGCDEVEEFGGKLAECAQGGAAQCCAPVLVDVVLRKLLPCGSQPQSPSRSARSPELT